METNEPTYYTCPTCNGSGENIRSLPGEGTCNTCGGDGEVPDPETEAVLEQSKEDYEISKWEDRQQNPPEADEIEWRGM